MKESSPRISIPEGCPAGVHHLRAPVKIPGGVDVNQHKEVEKEAVNRSMIALRPAGPGGIDDVHPHMGPVVMAVPLPISSTWQTRVHRFMSPVGRHAEDITHDHFEGDDRTQTE